MPSTLAVPQVQIPQNYIAVRFGDTIFAGPNWQMLNRDTRAFAREQRMYSLPNGGEVAPQQQRQSSSRTLTPGQKAAQTRMRNKRAALAAGQAQVTNPEVTEIAPAGNGGTETAAQKAARAHRKKPAAAAGGATA